MGPLNHSPADIIRQLIVDLGLGDDENGDEWATFDNSDPPSPDEVIVVHDTEGRDHGRSHYDGRRHVHHGFLVRVRSLDHESGYKKSKEIAIAFDETVYDNEVAIPDLTGTTESVYVVHSITRPNDIFVLGTEETSSKRHRFSINCLATIRMLV